ncbi:hypothetical protein LSH36_204g09004 [Paralvinella palmiformis]|uniref:Fibronectin type-III domain-containing protein n=1 Tax=Paralvinella palmiformis TaxID=53620 RepID=A0AAD9JRI0_9ANNE|nr:hypothetical protein LSH36_204g09004 [Paralvinella palmiformis]
MKHQLIQYKMMYPVTLQHLRVSILSIILYLIINVRGQCPCPIEEQSICYQCRCELTPENKMAINCKGKGLTEVPTFTYTSTAFEEVTLADNQISSLPASKFQQLHSLNQLDLTGNVISSVDGSAFQGLEDTLEELLLEVNAITNFPTNALTDLQMLKNLSVMGFDLSGSGLPSDALANLKHLIRLVLSNNRLQLIADDALSGQVNSLQDLVLDSNSFASIPTSAISSLLALETLSMAGNTGLSSIRENVFQGTHLKSLDLSQNGLSSVHPGAFSGLESTLEVLDMRSCQLQDNMLSPLQQLSSLKKLDLSSNSVANIPSDMFSQMTLLEMLQLHQNQIQTITGMMLSGLGQLRILDLSGNGLMKVEEDVFTSTSMLKQLTIGLNPNLSPSLPNKIFYPVAASLEVLYLEQTGFTESQWYLIQNLTKLKTLKLNENHIRTIPDMGFQMLHGLQNIYLEHNLLNQITQQQIFGPNAKLNLINFNSNNLTTLDQCTFFEFQQLDYYKLGLNDNPLTCDCKLKWLLQELKKHPNYDFLKYAVGWTCTSPSSLRDRKFAYEVNESDLVCDPPVTFPPCTDLTPVTTTTTTTSTTTATTTTLPDEPFVFTLNITAISDASMLLHWVISDRVQDDLLGFRIQYRSMPDGMDQYVDLRADMRRYELTGLEPATEHLICVIALGIQQTGNTICDSAITLPLLDEVSGQKDNTLIIALSCTLCLLIIISIIFIIVLIRRRNQKRKAESEANPFGIRMGYDSKRFSRATTPNTSTLNLHAFDNGALDKKCDGFSREEQNRILGQMSRLGVSTLSMLSTGSNMRYVQDRPKPPTPDDDSSFVVSNDADKHIYWEIPEEGAYQNNNTDMNLDRVNGVEIPDMDQSGITV